MENENPLLGEIQTYWFRRADSYSAEVQFELTHKSEAVWMDVQVLEFPDGCFDAVVTRNLTWNLEHLNQAYREWYRVLREGGVLLNFDAGWYNYLFDDEKAKEYEKDRNNVSNAGIHDFDAYSESAKMEEISRQKTDRRTRYTCMVIWEALLELLAEKDYRDITVADICRKAEVSRGTFYRHYDHIAQILDELFDQAMDRMHSVFVQIGCVTENGEQHTYPMCRFLRENRRYQPLFFADSLHDYVVRRLVEHCKESCIELVAWKERDGVGVKKPEYRNEEEFSSLWESVLKKGTLLFFGVFRENHLCILTTALPSTII